MFVLAAPWPGLAQTASQPRTCAGTSAGASGRPGAARHASPARRAEAARADIEAEAAHVETAADFVLGARLVRRGARVARRRAVAAGSRDARQRDGRLRRQPDRRPRHGRRHRAHRDGQRHDGHARRHARLLPAATACARSASTPPAPSPPIRATSISRRRGGIANFDARTNAGRDTTLAFTQRVGYEPFFNVFSQGTGGAPLPPGTGPGGSVPAAGLFERRSWNCSTSVSLDRRWGRSAGTSFGYAYRLQDFTGRRLRRQHVAQRDGRLPPPPRHRRAGARGLPLPGARLHGFGQHQPAHARPPDRGRPGNGEAALAPAQPLALGWPRARATSRPSASATRPAYDTWVPMGSARFRLTLSPTAYVESEYRRDFSLFQGVTDEVYATDTAYLRTGAHAHQPHLPDAGRHLQQLADACSPSGVTDTMDIYGATAQLRVLLSENVAATAGLLLLPPPLLESRRAPRGLPRRLQPQCRRGSASRCGCPLVGAPTAPPLTQR